MTNVEVGVGSIANVLSALESIGFTVDTTNSTAKWGYDTNNKLYFKAETNSSFVSCKSSSLDVQNLAFSTNSFN
jgi:hypothetical protein